jgi:multicomponent Na+:H+ antiporter subunit E
VSGPRNGVALRAAIARWLGFVCLWLVLSGTALADLLAGVITAAAAAWASLRPLPPSPGRLRPVPLVRLVARFFWQSAAGGIDVARRALDPRLPLRPGFVRYPLRLGPGPARGAFCAFSSLLPGTLVAGPEPDGALCVHCLDVGQDVPAQMRAEEEAFLAAVGARDG